ncbi:MULTISPECIES: DUF3108 domain-containing protein [unclassified Neisseria]|uniref:DUF3108 domain-containing protein n=1 Tax=unclassified Neisseria TaxID=2623750 RepID=UPI001072CCE4|nr:MULTISPECIES: DUF3108 domain-containing protein [unclassified Neisseria]MBF0804132.1 DUF3108 domain-containing protein [Neisseria sp. 19428wB4_WF04]TFU43148.1 DUF3108 domain-containing protein [Neisseria sp. WF04]
MKKSGITVLALALAAHTQAAPLPQSAELQYSGSYGIPTTMTFTRSGNRYKVVSNIKVPLYSIRFESGGTISGTRLIPSYYKDVRGGKTYAEAKFGGGKVSYGKAGEQKTEAVSGPVMDLFTLAWQLAAGNGKLPAGLTITNGKKIYPVGGLNHAGSGRYKIGNGTTAINKYRLKRGDSIINYAFAPELGNIPAQISYTDDGKTYDLQLTRIKINGKEVRPQ